MSKKKKKRYIGLKILTGFLGVAVVGIAGFAGYQAWQNTQKKQNQEKEAARLEESYQMEVSSMQSVYKEWQEAVNKETIYEGVTAMGINLAGLTEEEAEETLNSYYSEAVLNKTISLSYDGENWQYKYADLGFTANTGEIAASAYSMCRTGSLRDRYQQVQTLAANPIDLSLQDGYNASSIDRILETINEQITTEPKDATVAFEDGEFVITEEEKGQKLDIEATKEAMVQHIAAQESFEMELIVEEIEPEIKAEDLSKFGEVIGTFSTYYDLANTPRNKNLEVGCSKISGLMMQPGDSFNFNETVSPVDEASGYMEASTISDGVYVPGLGGGLCQVCTTLYNAVIRAELDVTERYSHSLEPGYVPNGQDAAMSIGGKNFQFVNSSKYPVYIVMSAEGGTLSCTIYGIEEHDPSRTVSFESELIGRTPKPDPIYTRDNTMYEDEQKITSYGHEGLKYDVYKVVTENGETTREYFNSSTYSATPDRITIGTIPRPAPQPEPESSSESEETYYEEPSYEEGGEDNGEW